MNNHLSNQQSEKLRELSNELRAIRESDISRTKSVIQIQHAILYLKEIEGDLIRDGVNGSP